MQTLTVLAVSLAISLGVVELALWLLHTVLKGRPSYPDESRVDRMLWLPVLVETTSVVLLQFDPAPLGRFAATATTVLHVVSVFSAGWIAFRASKFAFRWADKLYDISVGPDNLRQRRIQTQLRFLEKLVTVGLVALGFGIVLLTFEGGRQLGTSIVASAGVLSIAVGFAAQKSIQNLVAGFQIAFTQPIRLDDAVVVENEWGWIEEINLTYVVIRLWDRRRLVLPINYFIEKPFQNWTRNSAQILGSVHMQVDFGIDVDALEQEFFKVLDECPLWDRDAKVMQVVESHERSLEIRMLMTAKDSPTAFDLRCHVRRKMVEFIQRTQPRSMPNLKVAPVDPGRPAVQVAE